MADNLLSRITRRESMGLSIAAGLAVAVPASAGALERRRHPARPQLNGFRTVHHQK